MVCSRERVRMNTRVTCRRKPSGGMLACDRSECCSPTRLTNCDGSSGGTQTVSAPLTKMRTPSSTVTATVAVAVLSWLSRTVYVERVRPRIRRVRGVVQPDPEGEDHDSRDLEPVELDRGRPVLRRADRVQRERIPIRVRVVGADSEDGVGSRDGVRVVVAGQWGVVVRGGHGDDLRIGGLVERTERPSLSHWRERPGCCRTRSTYVVSLKTGCPADAPNVAMPSEAPSSASQNEPTGRSPSSDRRISQW